MRQQSSSLSPATKSPLRVAFVLAERFTLSAFAVFVDVLRLASDEGDRSRQMRCVWYVLGRPGQPVRSSCGVEVLPQQSFESPDAFDYIVVVGGLLHGGQRLLAGTIPFLQQAARAGVPLVGVCTGSFVLARAGLLEGHVVSVSWFHRDEFIAAFPDLQVVTNRQYVIDRKRITCAGGTSVVHLASELVERHLGHAAATKSLRILIQAPQSPARALQPEPVVTRGAADHVVQQAMLMLEDSLRGNITVAKVAEALGISARQLERRFKADIGLTPSEFKLQLRLARAAWLLETTDLAITQVAQDCGFGDASHFSRLFRAHFGRRPSAIRSQPSRTPSQPNLT
ncbi:GlxA family transcriptional regulator [bacterium]|nr:GlxA family transcriptional regulator [bacterium]